MNSYYHEIIEEITTLLGEGNINEAYFLLKKELEMPYIPKDAEDEFLRLKKEIAYQMSEHKEQGEIPLETLLERLRHDDPQLQLAAANALADRNLRICIEEIRAYLGEKPQPEAAAMLIEAIAEQEINDEFTIYRDGLEFNFWGDSVVPVERSEGFRKALGMLEDRFVKDPAMLQLARMILIHKAYLYLPLSFEEDEASMLAEECACELEELMKAVPEKYS